MHGYLGGRTLFTKSVGLALSVASGLSLGTFQLSPASVMDVGWHSVEPVADFYSVFRKGGTVRPHCELHRQYRIALLLQIRDE